MKLTQQDPPQLDTRRIRPLSNTVSRFLPSQKRKLNRYPRLIEVYRVVDPMDRKLALHPTKFDLGCECRIGLKLERRLEIGSQLLSVRAGQLTYTVSLGCADGISSERTRRVAVDDRC